MRPVARWLPLAAAICWGGTLLADTQTLTYVGSYDWRTDAVVGLSGLEVSQDGAQFQAVSDQGWFLSGKLTREDGVIQDLILEQLLPIQGNDGLPVAARPIGDWSDAEGLAVAEDGTYWVSFERWAHVSRFAGPGQRGQWIKDHPRFADHSDNKQLEAIALHPDGALYTFPESAFDAGFPIYKLDSNQWEIVGHIAQQDGFAIVGADFDALGQLYLLERKHLLGKFLQSRIRRLSIEAPKAVDILWTSTRGEFRNLEGIAIWPDADGLRLTMISDNNGDRSEPTQFVEFRLSSPAAGR